MSHILLTTLIGSAAGILGTGLGGAITFLINQPSNRLLSTLLSFSAGIMIAVVCFDLLPEAFVLGSLSVGIFGLVLGVLMVIVLDEWINRKMQKNKVRRGKGQNSPKQIRSTSQAEFMRAGILLSIGIAIHNLPEGLAIGSGFTAIQSYGISLSLVIALHDIPEGIAMATPLRIGGMSKCKVFGAAILAGIPTGIGAWLGYLLGEISPIFISLCLGFAGGAMLYITCSELIPESFDLHRGRMSSIGLIAGAIVGILLTAVI